MILHGIEKPDGIGEPDGIEEPDPPSGTTRAMNDMP
jgi:hypothetical protein